MRTIATDMSGEPTPRQNARKPSCLYASLTVAEKGVPKLCMRDLRKSNGYETPVARIEAENPAHSVR